MSYQLRTDEILEALSLSGNPAAAEYVRKVEAAANEAAQFLAQITGTAAGIGDFQGLGFAGLCVPFRPAFQGQPLPELLAGFDNPNEWGEAP